MIFSTCNQYSIKGIFLILLLMISTTFIQAQKADLSFSIYNPQNEMFRLLGTKRSFSQNETFFFSHP